MSDLQLPKPCMAKRLHHRHIQSMITSFNACDITYARYVRWQIDNKCKEFTLIVRAVPNILFGPNRRPNDVFTFRQIIRSKVDRILQVIGVQLKKRQFTVRVSKQDYQHYVQPPQQQPALCHKGTCSRTMQKLPHQQSCYTGSSSMQNYSCHKSLNACHAAWCSG